MGSNPKLTGRFLEDGSITDAKVADGAGIQYEKLDLEGQVALTDLVEGTAEITAEPGTLVLRDDQGRAQFADPAAPQDAATKAYVDAHAGSGGGPGDVARLKNDLFRVTAGVSRGSFELGWSPSAVENLLFILNGSPVDTHYTFTLTGNVLSVSPDLEVEDELRVIGVAGETTMASPPSGPAPGGTSQETLDLILRLSYLALVGRVVTYEDPDNPGEDGVGTVTSVELGTSVTASIDGGVPIDVARIRALWN